MLDNEINSIKNDNTSTNKNNDKTKSNQIFIVLYKSKTKTGQDHINNTNNLERIKNITTTFITNEFNSELMTHENNGNQ